MERVLLIAVFLMISPTCTEAFTEMNLCYILDSILILYGIILTILYCRLRMGSTNNGVANQPKKQPAEGGIYAGLTSQNTDVYETIKDYKKPIA